MLITLGIATWNRADLWRYAYRVPFADPSPRYKAMRIRKYCSKPPANGGGLNKPIKFT